MQVYGNLALPFPILVQHAPQLNIEEIVDSVISEWGCNK